MTNEKTIKKCTASTGRMIGESRTGEVVDENGSGLFPVTAKKFHWGGRKKKKKKKKRKRKRKKKIKKHSFKFLNWNRLPFKRKSRRYYPKQLLGNWVLYTN